MGIMGRKITALRAYVAEGGEAILKHSGRKCGGYDADQLELD